MLCGGLDCVEERGLVVWLIECVSECGKGGSEVAAWTFALGGWGWWMVWYGRGWGITLRLRC